MAQGVRDSPAMSQNCHPDRPLEHSSAGPGLGRLEEDFVKLSSVVLSFATLALVACGNGDGRNSGPSAQAGQITGAGSTFVYPVLSAWSSDFSKTGGVAVNYQSIGSGGGIAQI